MNPSRTADVLIIGAGIMGAALAQQIRTAKPNARIVMIDGGRRIGTTPGLHLHDVEDPDLRSRYVRQASPGIQSAYVGADVATRIENHAHGVQPGLYNVSALSDMTANFEGAAVGLNEGGMGVHWTAACPSPWGDEVFAHGDTETWNKDLQTARTLLNVHSNPYGTSVPGKRLLEVIGRVFGDTSAPGRHVQAMPMAITPDGDKLLRTGPNRIFPRMAQPATEDFELLSETLALALVHDGKRVTGARVRDTSTGRERTISAETVAVAADPLRTPQLLFASGIRPKALGHYLNEHAFLTGSVIADLEKLGLTLGEVPLHRPDEWVLGSQWLPHSGPSQPFHGQVMDRTYFDEHGEVLAYGALIGLYIPTTISAENRIEFSETRIDRTGMPELSIAFEYSREDYAGIERAKQTLQAITEAVGIPYADHGESELLPPGSSLHFTGTTRAGKANDGTSVCDPNGRVWGFSNLYLAGGSVVPTALVGNSTLTAVITAVRAARAIAALES